MSAALRSVALWLLRSAVSALWMWWGASKKAGKA